MKDYVIDSIAWQYAGDPRGAEVARDMVMAYKPLMRWLKREGLISNLALQDKPVDETLEIKTSDLASEGSEFFKLSHYKWLQSFDRIPIGGMTDDKAEKEIESIWKK